MGVNRPREERENQKPDNEQEVSNPPERQERNPITDPPQGENQNAEDREG